SEDEVPGAAGAGYAVLALVALDIQQPRRQPAQAQQDQHRGHGFHHQLGQGQVRRGQPEEGQADHQTGAADQRQGRQAVVLGLPRGGNGADTADQPEGCEGQVWSTGPERGPDLRGAGGSRQAREQAHGNDQHQLRLQAAGAKQALQPRGSAAQLQHDG